MSVVSTLDHLQPGGSAVVQALAPELENRRRLEEMGLLPGTLVACIRRAPLGDPIEIKVRGYLLTLSKHDAAHISVQTAP